MPPHLYPKRTLGIIIAIASFFCFSASDCLVMHLVAQYSLFQLLPFTSLVALSLIVAYAYYGPGTAYSFRRNRMRLATHYPVRQILRGLLGAASGFCVYKAYIGLPLANVYLISFMAPLLLALAAWAMFKERLQKGVVIAIGLGLAGVIIMLQPQPFSLSIYTIYAVLGVLSYCCNVLLARTMPKDDTLVFPLYTQGMLLLTTFIPAMIVWQGIYWIDLAYVLATGVFIAGASILFFQAYRLAPTSMIAPFQYTQLVWGILAGWLFFDSLPTLNLFVGALLIIGAGVFLMWESRRALRLLAQRLPITNAS